MTDLHASRKEALEALLDLFATLTGLPVGIYEEQDGNPVGVFSPGSLAHFDPHCQLIQSFPGGKERCEDDQCNRAANAIKSGVEGLTCCYAGMYNQAVPVKVGNGVHAVILFGEMQVADGEHQQRSLENHQQAVAQLELTQDQASNLRNRMLSSKPYTLEQLENFRFKLQPITQFLYKVFEEDERLKRNVEKVTHELQTRLQSVIAVSENLVSKVGNLETADLREKTNEVLNTALAMATVVNNWGAFAGSYHFRKQLLAPILYEAKRLYRAEAERRGIQIHISFEQESNGPTIEFSRDHMQLALNNFMHNAVKYSFRSQPGGKRFVKIIGIPAGRCYMITIENYGVGILPEEKDLIFQDEYQGKLTEREYRTGSGKGLYFAKQVIDRHHGRIKVDSRMMSEETHQDGRPHLNQFTIYVPYEQPQEDSPDAKNNCMD